MRYKDLRAQMLIPGKEYIIDQHINIRGIHVHILSFTIEEDKNQLWVIYEQENIPMEEFKYENMEEKRSNREKMLHDIKMRGMQKEFNISQIEIQGQRITFNSSRSSVVEMNIEKLMALQHFVEKGVDMTSWDEVWLENMVIAQYEQTDEEDVLVIDHRKELDMTVYIHSSSIKIPIKQSFKAEFGKQNVGTKILYYDEVLGRENYFFIDEIYSFDIYEDIRQKVEAIEDAEMKRNMLKDMENIMESLEGLCPKDKNLAVIKYESVDDIQLNFHMKEYLDSEPIIHSRGSAIGFIGSSINEMGINGYKLRECVLQPIDKDFHGELELELFSRYLIIPEESVEGLE